MFSSRNEKSIPTILMLLWNPKTLYISAGFRGMQNEGKSKDLASVVNAEFVELTMDH